MTEHNHDHDHEGHEHITLVDEQGNETLYEILLTVDGQEEFGKNYVLLYHRTPWWQRPRFRAEFSGSSAPAR